MAYLRPLDIRGCAKRAAIKYTEENTMGFSKPKDIEEYIEKKLQNSDEVLWKILRGELKPEDNPNKLILSPEMYIRTFRTYYLALNDSCERAEMVMNYIAEIEGGR